jgi:hypothetical protein
MESLLIKPKNKKELSLLKGLLKKMDIPVEIVRNKKDKSEKYLRPYALSKGFFKVEESFNEPLPEDTLNTFYE